MQAFMRAAPCDHARTLKRASNVRALLVAGAVSMSSMALGAEPQGRPIASPAAEPSAASSTQTTNAERLARALAYEHGEGLPKDQGVAAAIYCEAAVAGSAEAAFRLGWMYANGRGVEHDDGTAAALFDLAAAGGHAFAAKARAQIANAHGMLPDCMRTIQPPPPEPALAEDDDMDPFGDLSPDKKKVADVVNEVAPRYGIQPRLALAVIAVESNFVPSARSVKDARGLMQLIPSTAARFNVRNAYDIRDNVRGGLSYLRWLLSYYRGEVMLAAAAYNAGEGAVDRYRGVPPYPETRDYVRRVMQLFRKAQHPYDPSVVEPSIAAPSRAAGE
jgi:soluble lytic murein transglycosylase-like protein